MQCCLCNIISILAINILPLPSQRYLQTRCFHLTMQNKLGLKRARGQRPATWERSPDTLIPVRTNFNSNKFLQMPSYSALKYLTLTWLILLIKHYLRITPTQSSTTNELLLHVSCKKICCSRNENYRLLECWMISEIRYWKIKHAAGLLKRSAGDTVVWHVVMERCPQANKLIDVTLR